MNKIKMGTAALGLLATAGGAWAGEPLQLAQGPAAAAAGSFYVRAEGSYQSLDLPSVDLGQTHLLFPGVPANANGGPIATFRPTVTGYGAEGAFGFVLPSGMAPAGLGSNARIEFGTSYVNATDSQSSQVNLNAPGAAGTVAFQHVNGALSFFLICGADPCPTSTSLRTNYEAWHVDVKAASDFPMGSMTLTPSITAFGGEARNDQTLSQTVNLVSVPTFALRLIETASEKSTDLFGSKVGLKAKVDIAPWFALGLGGDLGLVDRRISLRAYDNSSGSGNKVRFASGSEVTAFLAGIEASAIFKPTSMVAIKLFGGANYDDHVAGIAAQNYSGVLFTNNPTTPVHIKTAGEVSYFAGLGVVVKFGL